MKYVSRFSDVEMAVVCDPVSESRNSVGDEYRIDSRYSTIEEMVVDKCLDAVFVAPPAHLNAKVPRRCLELGINTLLEKPPGMCVSETVSLMDTAERTGAKAMLGWNHRFHTLVVKARHLVEERGPIVQLVGEFYKSMSKLEQSGRFPAFLMDNMFLDSPIYSVDLIRVLAEAQRLLRSTVSYVEYFPSIRTFTRL